LVVVVVDGRAQALSPAPLKRADTRALRFFVFFLFAVFFVDRRGGYPY